MSNAHQDAPAPQRALAGAAALSAVGVPVGATAGTPEQRSERGRRAAQTLRERLAHRKPDGAPLLATPVQPLRDLNAALIRDMIALQLKAQRAIEMLPPSRAADHRALAATLIALSERVEAMQAAEHDRAGTGETYEARMARAYTSQNLPLPGRLAAALGGSARNA